MRTRSNTLIATIALAGALAVTGGATAAPNAKRLKCALHLTAQGAATATSGVDFGFVNCGGPLGQGLQYDKFTVTPTSATAGSVAGPFTHYFATGTAHGTFKVTFAATASGRVTYTGSFKYTGGTGAFRHIKGSGTLKGTSPDGVHSTFSANVTLTHT